MTIHITEFLANPETTSQIAFEQEFARRALELSPTITAPLAIAQPQLRKASGVRSLVSHWFSTEFRAKLRKLAPWLVSGGILGLNLVLHAPTFVVGSLIAGLTVQVVKTIIRSNEQCQRLWKWLLKKANLSEKKLPWLTAGFAGGAWMSAALPSQAAFFVQAEQYLQQILAVGAASGATALVPLLFGVLRVIFVIYIGVALVRVVNGFRNDEDWSTAARIPLIVVLCVVIGDALSTLIVQGANGGGGAVAP